VTSALGQGSTFSFFLPVAEDIDEFENDHEGKSGNAGSDYLASTESSSLTPS
jgi:hypothetical protein